MDDQVTQDILRRLKDLERDTVRLRLGDVTDRGSLDVDLGGSGISYEGLKAVGAFNDGDRVAALIAANDVLVLGKVGKGISYGAVSVTGDGSASSAENIAHELGVTPVWCIAIVGINESWQRFVQASPIDDTLIQVVVQHPAGSGWSNAVTVQWLAIA